MTVDGLIFFSSIVIASCWLVPWHAVRRALENFESFRSETCCAGILAKNLVQFCRQDLFASFCSSRRHGRTEGMYGIQQHVCMQFVCTRTDEEVVPLKGGLILQAVSATVRFVNFENILTIQHAVTVNM